MRDRRYIEAQQWLRDEQAWRADWERLVRTSPQVLEYNVASNPQYWIYLDYLPDLISGMTGKSGGLPVSAPGPQIVIPKKTHDVPVISVSVKAHMSTDSGNVNTAGFLGAVLGYLPSSSGHEPNDTNAVPIDAGNSIPSLGNIGYVNGPEDAVSYDPTSLPVGGVNFPIWTRSNVEPLTTQVYLDRSGPGILWYAAIVQINANLDVSDAVTVTSRWTWAPV